MKVLMISQRSDIDLRTSEVRDALDCNWHSFLKECGCVAIPVPNNANTLKIMLSIIPIDGIILSGGNTPLEYGGRCPERDAVDQLLIQHSINNNIPLIGVCRGMQSICLFFHGSLKKVLNHVGVHHRLVGTIDAIVNSYHEWSPEYVGEGIEVDCTSEDGQIEMIHHDKFRIWGIMWHPEREKPFREIDINFFKNVFQVNP